MTIKTTSLFLILFAFLLGGCSSSDSDTAGENTAIPLEATIWGAQIHGHYEAGTPLTEDNYISLILIGKETGKYHLSTAKVNGYSFSASGEFDAVGEQEIILQAEGTPEKEQLDEFKITTLQDEETIELQVLSNVSSKIVVASGERNSTGVTYAISGRGELLWEKEGYGSYATIIDGNIYMKYEGNLCAFNLETGAELWTNESFYSISYVSSYNNTIYVSELNGKLHAINPGDGSITWTHTPPSYHNAYGVTYKDNISYHASGEVYALSSDNTVLWHTDFITNGGESAPTISGNQLFVRDWYKLYAVDITNGSKLWEKDYRGIGSPVVYNNKLYLNTIDDKCLCLEPGTGDIIWEFTLDDLSRSPYPHDGKLYLTTDFGFTIMVALDATTGEELWKKSGSFAETDILVMDNIAYMGTVNNIVGLYHTTGQVVSILSNGNRLWHHIISAIYDTETKEAVYPIPVNNRVE
ncbi:outer membrane protein assembly factor BamB family protein [Carboxylicivirga taeanensis]|uniref:PQQ-binding-like beta-propeller repeat protein n=1 Tax=Carboxylicivirga taeanensis TaxID=1416875 RepID=UPI003F6E3BE7